MRFSVQVLLPIALLAVNAAALPAGTDALAADVTSDLPTDSLESSLSGVTSGDLTSSLPIDTSVASSSTSGLDLSDLSNLGLGALGGGVANITGELKELTTLLTTTDLPSGTLDEIVTILKETLGGIISTLGNATGLTGVSDSLNDLLDDTVSKLDSLLDNSGLDETLNNTLDAVLQSVKTILTKLLWTIDQVLENLLSLNLVGAIAALFSGALAAVDLGLTGLKNSGLPAK